MQVLDLYPHGLRCELPIMVSAIIERSHRDVLAVVFRVSGAFDQILWPKPARSGFADELWRHTCFEVFARADGVAAYREVNLSPSGEFAAYAFDGHRAGMKRADDVNVAAFSMTDREGRRDISAGIFFHNISRVPLWAIGLSVVVEALDGTKSYWALAHAPGPPDFHNADCFTARLAAPPAA